MNSKNPSQPQTYSCEAEIPEGLEVIAHDEIQRHLGRRLKKLDEPKSGSIRFDYQGDLHLLLGLRTVQAVYLHQFFPVPRPRALLGDQHFRTLLRHIAAVRALDSPPAVQTFYVSAAGSESSVMTRLKTELAAATGLKSADDEGDLRSEERRVGKECRL